ncbi:MAG: hypothetical protein IJ593_06940, partial [Lachnospiraceae bacterium]|nr:hypothetical protein [Lachnospiraceae bacterium]
MTDEMSLIENNITVEKLNATYTNKDQEYVRIVHAIKSDLGLLPKVYDSHNKVPVLNTPFSKYYNTLDEYIKDREKIEDIISQGKVIPDVLYNKMKET